MNTPANQRDLPAHVLAIDIREICATYFRVPQDEITGHRGGAMSWPRAVAIYLTHELCHRQQILIQGSLPKTKASQVPMLNRVQVGRLYASSKTNSGRLIDIAAALVDTRTELAKQQFPEILALLKKRPSLAALKEATPPAPAIHR